MAWLAAFVLPILLVLAGRGPARWAVAPGSGSGRTVAQGALSRWVVALLAGAVLFHLFLQALDACGLPWHPALLLLGLGLAAVLGRPRRAAAAGGLPSDLGWGDAVAGLCLVAFGLIAATLWITTPDFYFHWGLKGERFFLAGGIDWTFLRHPWNGLLHPDYPNLLPGLYAATALLAGRFHAPALMLWSAVACAAILAAGRNALAAAGLERPVRQAAMAFLGMALTAYAAGYLFAGGADLLLALALTAALPPLLGFAGAGPRAALWLGIVAAFAASSKIEGIPLAAFLVGSYLVSVWRCGERPGLREIAMAALPTAAAVVPWFAGVRLHGLFQPTNRGPFDLGRLGALLPAMGEAGSTPELHGLPWLALLAPVLLLSRRVRPFALAATAQLLFYGWAYVASTLDPRLYVLTSFARLLFHLVPATIVAAAVAAGGIAAPRERDPREAETVGG
jgi:hypothetical protein